MALRIQIAKFKFRQYLLRTNSPNLMLAKFSRYTVASYPDHTVEWVLNVWLMIVF